MFPTYLGDENSIRSSNTETRSRMFENTYWKRKNMVLKHYHIWRFKCLFSYFQWYKVVSSKFLNVFCKHSAPSFHQSRHTFTPTGNLEPFNLMQVFGWWEEMNSTQKEPTRTQHENSTQKGTRPTRGFKPGTFLLWGDRSWPLHHRVEITTFSDWYWDRTLLLKRETSFYSVCTTD